MNKHEIIAKLRNCEEIDGGIIEEIYEVGIYGIEIVSYKEKDVSPDDVEVTALIHTEDGKGGFFREIKYIINSWDYVENKFPSQKPKEVFPNRKIVWEW